MTTARARWIYRAKKILTAPWCRHYIEPGCGKGWHCEACLVTPLLHRQFWIGLLTS